jgi:hypothetical protein
MPELRVNCPSCSAPISFRPGTMVTVCGYCRALSARTDRDPRLIGKVADLVATGSPLALGMEGSFAGRTFHIVGRTQLQHPLGGVWDEWYLSFQGDRWGWLAEAQGRFYLTFKQDLGLPPPALETLVPGSTVDLGPHGHWVVGETSQGTVASAEGEIPWEVDLGAAYPFSDLSAPNGAFATLDFGDVPPTLYTGRETPLADLKLHGGPALPSGPRLRAQSLPCPHCASPLTLQAPDQAQRVGCPSCGSLLDASQGRLTYLKSLQQPEPRMLIPLGTEGTLRDNKVVVAGFLIRSCVLDGERFPWREYLLLDRDQHSFLWLVESDGHWSLAQNVAPADVGRHNVRAVRFGDELYRRYQDYEARVEGVYGEFYWKVEQGEMATVSEFACAPHLLAEEVQKHAQGAEVNWSLSTYLDGSEVMAAFGLKTGLPTPEGIAPHQPNPHKATSRTLFRWMWAAFALWFLVLMVQCATHRNALIYQATYDLAEAAERQKLSREADPPAEAGEVVFFSEPFELKEPAKNLAVTVRAPVQNAWVEVDGALASESSDTVEFFQAPLSYYSGVDGGESWSEGSQKETVYLSSLPKGTYVLRIAPAWEGAQPPVRGLSVELRSGAMHPIYYLLSFLLLLVVPLIHAMRSASFETARWANSSFGNTAGGDE